MSHNRRRKCLTCLEPFIADTHDQVHCTTNCAEAACQSPDQKLAESLLEGKCINYEYDGLEGMDDD